MVRMRVSPRADYPGWSGRLAEMQQRSLLKVGIAIAISVVVVWLLWVVLLGPAALMLLSPRA